ncbi:MAG: hypothetical protein LJE65_07570 [Desulfobacteraceae bacterium]|nr:hypothetical protein [Desulfobacteraceae bacterium]
MENLKMVLFALFAAVVIFLLMGAYSGDAGRYQLSVAAEDSSVAVFAMDTATGQTKLVFFSHDGSHRGQLGKSFPEMDDNYYSRR